MHKHSKFSKKHCHNLIGSIVLLKGATKKLLIIARAINVVNNGKQYFFEYGAVIYPEGLMGDQIAYFNRENISKIVFEGFSDIDNENMVDTIRAYLDANPNLIKGSNESWNT